MKYLLGIALDHSTSFPNHPCGPDKKEKNYTICFATFSVLMGAALITATQINFKYDELPSEPQEEQKPQQIFTEEDRKQAQLAEQLNLPSLADTRASDLPPVPKEQKVSCSTFFLSCNNFLKFLDENLCSDNSRNARMANSSDSIQKPKVCFIFIRRLVYGLRNRTHLYIPFLASSRLWWYSHAFRCSFCHQPCFRNIRLFLQF